MSVLYPKRQAMYLDRVSTGTDSDLRPSAPEEHHVYSPLTYPAPLERHVIEEAHGAPLERGPN